MMTHSTSAPQRGARAVAVTCAAALAVITLATACADKGIMRPRAAFSPKISLQVTITADQQAAFGPRFLVAAAGFDGEKNSNDDGGGFLGKAVIPFTPGTHTLTVPIDLSPCLAYWSQKGRAYCPLLIGAAILPDTSQFTTQDSTGGDIFDAAFDFYFDGPYPIAPGGVLPTIKPLDLSVSRFGVVKWEGDNALQLGGSETPNYFSGPITGVPGVGTAPPTLFATTQGWINSFSSNNQGSQGPYPVLAIMQNGSWRRVFATVVGPQQSQQSPQFTDVAAVAANEAYMAHRTGLYKFDGTSISKVTAVTDSVYSLGSAVTATGAKYVIAGGWNGVVWISNGQTWQRYTVGSTVRLDGGVCITGPNEAFAASTSGGLWRFNGTNWTSVPAPNNTAGKVNLQCPAPGQAFVIAQSGQRLSWNGSTWVTLPNTGLGAGGRSFAWAVVSPTEIYAAGDSATVDRAFYRFNGTSWQEIGRLRYTQPITVEPWADPRGSAYFASTGFGRVEKASGTSVSVVSYAPSLRDVAMNSLTSAFVVGENLFLARWDGAKWTVDAPPAGVPAARLLRGVWSDGAKNAWAVGPGGGGSVFRYDGVGWSTVPVGVADNWQAVWGTGSDVWITGNTNIVHCKAAAGCSIESSGGSNTLFSVWGSSNTNVFAVGGAGRIARFNGTTWSEMTRPTSRTLLRVGGSGPDDVWAVGDSVILHFDGSQWATVVDSLDDLRQSIGRSNAIQNGAPNNIGLWARGPKEMYFTANYGNVERWNGARWSGMSLNGFRHTMMGISGVKPECALGVTETQSDPASPSLYRGIGSSGCLLAPMSPPTSWP